MNFITWTEPSRIDLISAELKQIELEPEGADTDEGKEGKKKREEDVNEERRERTETSENPWQERQCEDDERRVLRARERERGAAHEKK